MINALYSSQHGGTKLFKLNGTEFGWKSVIDLYTRHSTIIFHVTCKMNILLSLKPHVRDTHVVVSLFLCVFS